MSTPRIFDSAILRSLCLALVLSLLPASAQQDQAEFDAANALLDGGQYAEAVAAFEKFVADYPTNNLIFDARLRLAYALYFNKQFDKAVEQIGKITIPPTPDAVIERALLLLPQITSAKAATAGGDAQKKTFQKAIQEFGEFIKKYPKSGDMEQALYGRALAALQIQDLTTALADLRLAVQSFPKSPTIDDSRYLLALALATQGNMLAFGTTPDPAGAGKAFDEARTILTAITTENRDIALANDAMIQLGNVIMNQAMLLPENDTANRDTLLAEAVGRYRAVLSKDPLIKVQEQRVETLKTDITTNLRARNLPLVAQLRKSLERETAKLETLKGRPDQKLSALLQICEVFYRKNDWNSLRVLADYLRPFASTPEDTKRILFYSTVSLIGHGLKDRAVAGYDEFNQNHPRDPLGENLPLMMSGLFLAGTDADPNKAIAYLQEAQTNYPNSPNRDQTMLREGMALFQLGKAQDAMEKLKELIGRKPLPEITVTANYSLAQSYESLGDLDNAIATYKLVREADPEGQQGEIAAFQIGMLYFRKGDLPTSLSELDAFIGKYAASNIMPNALFTKGQCLDSLKKSDEALVVYKKLAAEHKESPVAPFAYFQIAAIHQMAARTPDMVAILEEFIAAYPEFEDKSGQTLFFNAFDLIATTLAQESKLADAILRYETFVEKRPADENTPVALLKAHALSRQQAESLGRFLALTKEEQDRWKASVAHAQKSLETILTTHPESLHVPSSLQALLSLQQLRLTSDLIKPAELVAYFTSLAESNAANAGMKSKILFTLAGYVAQTDKVAALKTMSEAYDATLIYSPADLERYGLALADGGDFEAALAVFQKLEGDFPLPEGVEPAAAQPNVAIAQAGALFGRGIIAKKQGDDADAATLFTELKQKYPFSNKVMQADIALAESEAAQGNFDPALSRLSPIIAQQQAPGNLRAQALLIGGKVHAQKEDLTSALDWLRKCSSFFPDEGLSASEALLKEGEVCEKLAANEADPKKRDGIILDARKAYAAIIEQYPDTPSAPKANERLGALGGPPKK